jgi:hypothetical protein
MGKFTIHWSMKCWNEERSVRVAGFRRALKICKAIRRHQRQKGVLCGCHTAHIFSLPINGVETLIY